MPADLDIAIIGAGFSGLAAAHSLRASGRTRFAVFEAAEGAGGVWRDNIYPGCRCDIPSQLYELEAHPNRDWSANFAPQSEILTYLGRVADDLKIAQHIRYSHRVLSVTFERAAGKWTLRFADRATVRARALIVATGPLSRPQIPDLAGRNDFAGSQVHSACWDSSLNYKRKRVAVVGTGASAVQIVPELAQQAAHLFVVQRSPAWILPRMERRFGALERWLYRRVPGLHRAGRAFHYRKLEFFGQAYQRKGLAYCLLMWSARRKLKKEVSDPDLRHRLRATERIGCKRAALSDDYLPSFSRSNVTLIDGPVVALAPKGIITNDGREVDVDMIVWATGFQVTNPAGLLPIINGFGVALGDVWEREGAQAYRGSIVAGFPNMLYLLGPNGGLGHSSAVHFAESQVRYALSYLKELDRLDLPRVLDLPRDRQDEYNNWVQEKLKSTVWGASTCNSWYTDAQGVNRAIFPGLCDDYRHHMSNFDPTDFEDT